MRTLITVGALIAALDVAAVSSPVPSPSLGPVLLHAADGQGVLIARGGMGGGGVRPGGGMGGGGGGGGMSGGGGGMGGGGGGMGGGGGGMGGFGGMMGSGFWGRGPAADPNCGQGAHKSKNSKKARRGTPRCDVDY